MPIPHMKAGKNLIPAVHCPLCGKLAKFTTTQAPNSHCKIQWFECKDCDVDFGIMDKK